MGEGAGPALLHDPTWPGLLGPLCRGRSAGDRKPRDAPSHGARASRSCSGSCSAASTGWPRGLLARVRGAEGPQRGPRRADHARRLRAVLAFRRELASIRSRPCSSVPGALAARRGPLPRPLRLRGRARTSSARVKSSLLVASAWRARSTPSRCACGPRTTDRSPRPTRARSSRWDRSPIPLDPPREPRRCPRPHRAPSTCCWPAGAGARRSAPPPRTGRPPCSPASTCVAPTSSPSPSAPRSPRGGTLVSVGYSISPSIGLEWTLKALIVVVLARPRLDARHLRGRIFVGVAEALSAAAFGGPYREVAGS